MVDSSPPDRGGSAPRRFFLGLIAAAPGAGLLWLYLNRLRSMRIDPSLSPGTPAETWIALMVMATAFASLALGLGVGRGRIGGPLGASGFLSIFVVTLVMIFGFVRLA